MQASGKVVAVTGGGNGIGRELVLGLLVRGARVAALDVSEAGLQETARLAGAGSRLSVHHADVTDRDMVAELPDAIIAAHGSVDGLINCAGIIQPFVKINDIDYTAIERVFNVNMWGVINMTKAFLPYLLERPEAHVVNVSSMGAFVPVPGQAIYGASKAAVKLFTEALYSELSSTGVSVTCAFPGAIHTEISANSGVHVNADMEKKASESKIKMTEPVVAAHTILDAMERDAYRVMVGSDASLMDRFVRLMPRRAADTIQKQMAVLLAD